MIWLNDEKSVLEECILVNYKKKLIIKDLNQKVINQCPDSAGKEVFGIREFREFRVEQATPLLWIIKGYQ